jgi:hypothetical protein
MPKTLDADAGWLVFGTSGSAPVGEFNDVREMLCSMG